MGQLRLDNVQLIKEVLEGNELFETHTRVIISEVFANLADLSSEFFYMMATKTDETCLEEVLS